MIVRTTSSGISARAAILSVLRAGEVNGLRPWQIKQAAGIHRGHPEYGGILTAMLREGLIRCDYGALSEGGLGVWHVVEK